MVKTRTALAIAFLSAFLLALGPGTCCLASPKSDTGSQPCHRDSSRTPPKDASHGCCQGGTPCACDVKNQGSRAFLEIPAASLVGKTASPSPEEALLVQSLSTESFSTAGATADAPSNPAPGVPLYLLHRILLL